MQLCAILQQDLPPVAVGSAVPAARALLFARLARTVDAHIQGISKAVLTALGYANANVQVNVQALKISLGLGGLGDTSDGT